MKYFLLTLLFSFILVSCKKKDVIEIYLTKKRIESYDGVSLEIGIKNKYILNRIQKLHGNHVRIDTIKDKIIYMGRFKASKSDLQQKPLIYDSEIIGLDINNSRIYFKQIVQKRIYDSLKEWNKNIDSEIGKQYVICLNNRIISNGYFDGMWTKYNSNTNRILYHNSQNKKGISFIIKDSLGYGIDSLKHNKILIKAFKNRLMH